MKDRKPGGRGGSRRKDLVDLANSVLIPLTTKPKRIPCLFSKHTARRSPATLYPDGFYCYACEKGLKPFDYFITANSLSVSQGLEQLGFRTQDGHQHGTYVCYVQAKCRCKPCTAANAAYMRAYRQRRAAS